MFVDSINLCYETKGKMDVNSNIESESGDYKFISCIKVSNPVRYTPKKAVPDLRDLIMGAIRLFSQKVQISMSQEWDYDVESIVLNIISCSCYDGSSVIYSVVLCPAWGCNLVALSDKSRLVLVSVWNLLVHLIRKDGKGIIRARYLGKNNGKQLGPGGRVTGSNKSGLMGRVKGSKNRDGRVEEEEWKVWWEGNKKLVKRYDWKGIYVCPLWNAERNFTGWPLSG